MPYNMVKTYAERNIIHRTPKMKNMILELLHLHWEKKKKKLIQCTEIQYHNSTTIGCCCKFLHWKDCQTFILSFQLPVESTVRRLWIPFWTKYFEKADEEQNTFGITGVGLFEESLMINKICQVNKQMKICQKKQQVIPVVIFWTLAWLKINKNSCRIF